MLFNNITEYDKVSPDSRKSNSLAAFYCEEEKTSLNLPNWAEDTLSADSKRTLINRRNEFLKDR